MLYRVDGWNNFCRVFELPEQYPSGYCFGGGLPVAFQMVDWFNPVTGVDAPACSKDMWREKVGNIQTKEIADVELRDGLIPFLRGKNYVKPNRKHLVICDFGATFIFEKSEG